MRDLYIKPNADTTLQINGVTEGSVVSGGTAAINLVDGGGDPVTPDSVTVVGDTYTVEVPSGGAPDIYALDPFSVAVGWGVTRLHRNSNYVCRVRRSSDNAERNISLDGNLIDTSDILAWSGSDSVYLVILYAQGTLPINITFTNPANQPMLVNAGTVVLDDNGLPAFDFQGSKFTINTKIDLLDSSNNFATFSVASQKNSSNFSPIFSTNTPNPRMANYIDASANRFSYIFGSDLLLLPNQDSTTTPRYQLLNKVSNNTTSYKNTSQTDVKTIGSYPNNEFCVGMDFGVNFSLTGYLQCLAIIGQDIDATQRTYIDTIIMNDYDI